ncbi:MAG TPA: multicopper oxidase family protein [Candidatus Competibacteraceae bacterium]|nr:multicopper oxidase family protein [Candidatus Competibacteraceae bacterium]
MVTLSRRTFLKSLSVLGAASLAPSWLLRSAAAAGDDPVLLRADTRVIEVNGRSATVFGLLQPDGRHGLITELGRPFRVRLENRLGEPTLIHWHGLTPPNAQDGVPEVSQPVLAAGAAYDYDFPLTSAGTHWMHSHHGLQEQRLLAAPLIVRDPAEARADEQEVVILLHDFTFRDPAEIFAGLRGAGGHGAMVGMAGMDHGAMGQGRAMAMDLNDVEYDAYLANDRTLDDPEVVRVERGGRVRLRIINGATSTAFFIHTGALEAELIAVDGNGVEPLRGRSFEIAMGQRLDLRLQLPAGEGAFPVLAVREGDRKRTGVILATAAGKVAKLAGDGGIEGQAAGVVDGSLEARLRALQPLAERQAERRHTLELTGNMDDYVWGLDGKGYGEHESLPVRRGERVEITLINRTRMSHPMHLHGHHFQVVAIGERRIKGAVRDTVQVPVDGRVTLAFDADNPGTWMLHCHNLLHMAAGMMTSVVYQA